MSASAATIYIAEAFESREELLQQLGGHRMGKACLYIKRLSDIRLPVLEQLIVDSVADTRRRYPKATGGA